LEESKSNLGRRNSIKGESIFKSVKSQSELDGTVIHKVDGTEVANEPVAQEEDLSLQHTLIPFSLLWLCRLNMIFYIYMYHNWWALFILVWVQHSMVINSLTKFRVVTLKVYMPIFIAIFLLYYITNCNGILKPDELDGS
jgi:hypothetical protein